MLTFSTVRNALRATWPDVSDKVRTIAARYYIGADTADDLEHMTRPQPYYLHYPDAPPVLTKAEVDVIISRR